MKSIKERIHGIVELIHSVKDKNLGWQAANQGQKLQLSHERTLAEQNLADDLAKKSVQLAHEIELLKTRQSAELSMLKTRCKEDVKDYQQYLDSLNQLKLSLQSCYGHLPPAITHTIHHHAKALLNAMWEAETLVEKIRLETQLIQFMATVHDETLPHRSGTAPDTLPENTLKLINQGNKRALTH